MARSHWLDLGLEGCPVNGNGMAWHGVVWFHLFLLALRCATPAIPPIFLSLLLIS